MNSSKNRVLVTGATGLIGRELEMPLHDMGFEIYAITIDDTNPNNSINWVKGNLFDESFIRRIMKEIQPTHLLNMAWKTTGDYLSSDVNYKFLQAGINLAQSFVENNGQRAVYAGTCFEYRFNNNPIRENSNLDPTRNEYVFCKAHLNEIATRIFARAGVSFGYGRIFNAFGRGEPCTRLTGMIINSLQNGEKIVIKGGPLCRDYIYSKDVANAFVALLNSSVEGPVNIATGQPVTIREFVLALGRRLGKEHLISFQDDFGSQPHAILADVTRLITEVGYKPQYDIRKAFEEIV